MMHPWDLVPTEAPAGVLNQTGSRSLGSFPEHTGSCPTQGVPLPWHKVPGPDFPCLDQKVAPTWLLRTPSPTILYASCPSALGTVLIKGVGLPLKWPARGTPWNAQTQPAHWCPGGCDLPLGRTAVPDSSNFGGGWGGAGGGGADLGRGP